MEVPILVVDIDVAGLETVIFTFFRIHRKHSQITNKYKLLKKSSEFEIIFYSYLQKRTLF